MSSPTSARPARTVLVALAIGVALLAALGYQSFAAPSSSASSPIETGMSADGRRGLGVADGRVRAGVTVLDDVPAVANLDGDLLAALRRAAQDAAGDGITFRVNSGWRSRAYQQHLLREAIAEHGSRAEAARWVATPDTSLHVMGRAIDLGGSDATAWLADHGAAYGLCQVYDNEPWHYELRREAVDQGCPPRYADPTRDPRMQQ